MTGIKLPTPASFAPGVAVAGKIASAKSPNKSVVFASNNACTSLVAERVQPSKNKLAPITVPPKIKATRCNASLLFILLNILILEIIFHFPTLSVITFYILIDVVKVGDTHVIVIPQQFQVTSRVFTINT